MDTHLHVDPDDTWISLEQAVRSTYESMAERWRAQDMAELARRKSLQIGGVGGHREVGATAKDGTGFAIPRDSRITDVPK